MKIGELPIGHIKAGTHFFCSFTANYLSVLDFQTNQIAVIDSTLKSGNQQNMYCFVMDLDRHNVSRKNTAIAIFQTPQISDTNNRSVSTRRTQFS